MNPTWKHGKLIASGIIEKITQASAGFFLDKGATRLVPNIVIYLRLQENTGIHALIHPRYNLAKEGTVYAVSILAVKRTCVHGTESPR